MARKKLISVFGTLLMVTLLCSIFPLGVFAQGGIGKVTGSNVNVRQGPGTQYARIANLSAGQFVKILGEKDNWFQIQLADGTKGWTAGWLISLENQGPEKAVVEGSVVNIRKGPGTQYAVSGQVKAGTELSVLKRENNWILVMLPNGSQGWIADWLVKVSRVAGAQAAVINGSNVNIRQGAGTTYPLLFQLNKGDQVTIKDQKSGWYLIESSKGTGWVASWLVSAPGVAQSSRNAVVTGSIVNVRKEPSTQAARVTQVKAGDVVQIIGEKNDWYQVKTGSGKEGWIANWLLSLETTLTPTETEPSTSLPPVNQTPVETVSKTVIVTGSVVNIRQGGSLNYPTIAKVNGGTELKVLAQQGDWLKVQLNDGRQGWIAGWLTVDKNSKPLPQPEQYISELKLTLDNEKVLALNNMGDKLAISLSGVENSQYQISRADGNRLIIQLKSANMRETVQPFDNWGVKEIQAKGQVIAITFDKDFQHKFYYNNSDKKVQIDITYPSHLLIPVKQIKLNPQENQAVVQIAAGSKITYTAQEAGPNKLVIDLPQSSLQLASQTEAEQNVNYGPIRKITSRQLAPDLVRIEAELAPGAQYQVSQQDDYIVLGARLSQKGGLAGKTIVIDPGHGSIQPGGWTDPGAIGKNLNLKERDVNLAGALKLQQLLTQQGAKVVMTHSTGSTHLSLAGRAEVANNIGADIFVSIHSNSNNNSAISGTTVYYYAPTWHSELASQRWLRQRLALSIQNELVKAGGRKDNGILEENYAVLRETKVPSVLVEMAYLSNPEEERLLATDQFRYQMALGIFRGIENYFKSL
ncbi:MAG: SH3 domain-containing protein [Clostridia bacterium]|nr:SH3 domain-containing protein [Clostridia bacterium]